MTPQELLNLATQDRFALIFDEEYEGPVMKTSGSSISFVPQQASLSGKLLAGRHTMLRLSGMPAIFSKTGFMCELAGMGIFSPMAAESYIPIHC